MLYAHPLGHHVPATLKIQKFQKWAGKNARTVRAVHVSFCIHGCVYTEFLRDCLYACWSISLHLGNLLQLHFCVPQDGRGNVWPQYACPGTAPELWPLIIEKAYAKVCGDCHMQ